ncbi:MAG: hypothetical protein H6622_13270 [Halobacteriovoraceae bacterium]|nr:hypothetical protein [Halobacteriovoraceae bacterium]
MKIMTSMLLTLLLSSCGQKGVQEFIDAQQMSYSGYVQESKSPYPVPDIADQKLYLGVVLNIDNVGERRGVTNISIGYNGAFLYTFSYKDNTPGSQRKTVSGKGWVYKSAEDQPWEGNPELSLTKRQDEYTFVFANLEDCELHGSIVVKVDTSNLRPDLPDGTFSKILFSYNNSPSQYVDWQANFIPYGELSTDQVDGDPNCAGGNIDHLITKISGGAFNI